MKLKNMGGKEMKFDTPKVLEEASIPMKSPEIVAIEAIEEANPNIGPVDLLKKEQETAISRVNQQVESTRSSMVYQARCTGLIQKLSDEMDVRDPQSIVDFGASASADLSKTADMVLKHYDLNITNESTRLMGILSSLMNKIDLKEITEAPEEKKGLLAIFKASLEKQIQQIMNKYNTIGGELEKVVQELKTYQKQIEQSNRDIDALYESSIEAYKKLVAYIEAGNHAMHELDAYIDQTAAKANSGDTEAAIQLGNLNMAKELLSQRVLDLQGSESVALQTLPALKSMEFGNYNLSRKISSSFIVTLPIFKTAIAQAVIAKQQMLQAQGLKALDDKTNEMLLRNSQNVVSQMKMTTRLAGESSIKMSTIEQSWETIINGIRDTQQIQQEIARQRAIDSQKLNEINSKYSKFASGIVGIN